MNSWHVDSRTAVDFIEPEIEVRQAGTRFIDLLNDWATQIGESLVKGDINSANVSFWSGAYALGIKFCGGVTMTERAREIGVERATISKNAKRFITDNRLSPSFYMKDKEAGRAYCKARLQVVVANGNGHKKWPLK